MNKVNISSKSRDYIDIKKSWNLNHWCQEFNLRAEELIRIVKRVGPSLAAIRHFLENNPSKDILKH